MLGEMTSSPQRPEYNPSSPHTSRLVGGAVRQAPPSLVGVALPCDTVAPEDSSCVQCVMYVVCVWQVGKVKHTAVSKQWDCVKTLVLCQRNSCYVARTRERRPWTSVEEHETMSLTTADSEYSLPVAPSCPLTTCAC